MTDQEDNPDYTVQSTRQLLEQTTQIVSAYVGYNSVSADALPDLIVNVHTMLINTINEANGGAGMRLQPAVAVKQSLHDDYIICLEDGKKFKSLKRHIRTYYGLTPEEYRKRWGLPADYPMVAPNYAKKRAKLARQYGLGRKAGSKVSKSVS